MSKMNFKKQSEDLFHSVAWPNWPQEFPISPTVARYENDVEIEKTDTDDQLEQKLNSLCRRSFLQAETAEERKFLSRVCDDVEDNKGNDILYDEESSSSQETEDNPIRKLPRLSSGYGYGHHQGKI